MGASGARKLIPGVAVPDLGTDDVPVLYDEAEQQGWRDAVTSKLNALLASLRGNGVLDT